MAFMDPCTFALLPGPPLSAFLSGYGDQPTAEFDDAYLRAMGALPPLPPAHFASTPVQHVAALHESIELPSTCELYAAALDDHLFQPAAEAPLTNTTNSGTRPSLPDYDAEINFNLREMEKNANQQPSPDYLKTVQGGRMSKSTRADLVSWMDDFTRYFDLAPGTLHRAVSYVDRVLSERTLSPTNTEDELHLIGATAAYIAAKYEDQSTRFKVNATGIAGICGLNTASKEVIDMELSMSAALQYDLGGPTAYTFVDHFTRFNKGGEVQQLAHHLAEKSLADYRLLQFLPSAVAASAVFLARLILNPTAIQVQQWNEDFEELTGYNPTDLVLTIESLYMMNPDPRFDVLPAFLQGQIMVFK